MTAAGSTESNLSVGRKQKSEQKAKLGRHTALRSEGGLWQQGEAGPLPSPVSLVRQGSSSAYLGSPDQAPPGARPVVTGALNGSRSEGQF